MRLGQPTPEPSTSITGVWRSLPTPLRRLLLSDVFIRTCDGMVDVFLVFGNHQACDGGTQFFRALRAAFGDFDEVLAQIEKLLAVGKRVDQAFGHGRRIRRPPAISAASRSTTRTAFSTR